MAIFSTT
ncbi:hypothetical protein D029_2414A, partial [Vibrio parahaemolyticus 970107]